jgi:hypothetical protein
MRSNTYTRCRNRRLLAVRDLMVKYREVARIGMLVARFRCSMPERRAAPGGS